MESVVLVDEAGYASGTADKTAVHHAQTPLHLAFSCYLFNKAGQFLLTRRAESKRTWPGVWTNTCCGHPLPGEPMSGGVLRRLRRRTRDRRGQARAGPAQVPVPGADGQRSAGKRGLPGLRGVTPTMGAPDPDPAEVADAWWVDWDEFCEAVRAGRQPISPWCAMQLRELTALGPRPLDWIPGRRGRPAARGARLSGPHVPAAEFPQAYTASSTRPPQGCPHRWVYLGQVVVPGSPDGSRGASPRARSSSTSSSTSSGTRPPAVQSAQRMPTKLPTPV